MTVLESLKYRAGLLLFRAASFVVIGGMRLAATRPLPSVGEGRGEGTHFLFPRTL